MGVTKKLLLLIATTLAVAFIIVTLFTSFGVVDNNSRLVSSIIERLEADNEKSAELLTENSHHIDEELREADEVTREIILNLYSTSFDTLVKALANQVFPMVESFDFDSPRSVIEKMMASNEAIKGVRFATSENPGPADIYVLGKFSGDADRQSFTHEIRGDFAYLKIDMQVSLSGMQALSRVDEIFSEINKDNQELVEDLKNGARQSLSVAEEFALSVSEAGQQKLIRLNILLMVVGLVAICLILGIFISRLITRPMARTVAMIEGLEQGYLDTRLNMDSQDEIGRMAKAMDAFADNLKFEILTAFQKLADGDFTFKAKGLIREPLARANAALNEVMAQIQVAGEQISSGSGQISDSSQALSQGATDQASFLEEITSSMAEMASQTKQNAENATQTNQLSAEAKGAAEKGNEQMQAMVTAMGEINESGQNISKIIKVIDEIAFQTNLLALNAAVEAARAGQHGKGFAVVAEEVRNLAARSAKAASETSELIEGSVKKAEAGAQIADKTAEALSEIVTGVTKVTDLVAEIAIASNKQAQGIAQVNQGLGQIEQVTQQNTANAEESAAAAEELFSQAGQLRQMLTRFKLKDIGVNCTGTFEAGERKPVTGLVAVSGG